jgi:hypothetical protein
MFTPPLKLPTQLPNYQCSVWLALTCLLRPYRPPLCASQCRERVHACRLDRFELKSFDLARPRQGPNNQLPFGVIKKKGKQKRIIKVRMIKGRLYFQSFGFQETRLASAEGKNKAVARVPQSGPTEE